AIIVTEVSDRKLAETVWENTDVENGAIVVLDSMQAVTASDIKDGVSYISIMEKNLDAIKSTF
ncbi:MAG: zinc ABC transporter substrate-binding protein, partial [Lachnospiraceae bacterium]|nr:zinc ABC transporter substrate-binding protein [Lachnospiraceae bacterium]